MSTQDKTTAIAPRGPSASARWLLERGWKQQQRVRRELDAWCWYKPPYRGTFYRLKDAVELERNRLLTK